MDMVKLFCQVTEQRNIHINNNFIMLYQVKLQRENMFDLTNDKCVTCNSVSRSINTTADKTTITKSDPVKRLQHQDTVGAVRSGHGDPGV